MVGGLDRGEERKEKRGARFRDGQTRGVIKRGVNEERDSNELSLCPQSLIF